MIRFRSAKTQKGFALLEALLVVAVIAILAGVVAIAINPDKQVSESRNLQRQADIAAILNAVSQYSREHNGTLPSAITTTSTEICATDAANCTGLADLGMITGSRLAALPKEPQCSKVCASNGIGYKIMKDANNRITITAPSAELDKEISVTR